MGAVSRVCKWGLHDFYEQKSFSISALFLYNRKVRHSSNSDKKSPHKSGHRKQTID